MNKVILIGRLTSEPELRQTTSGIPVCRIRIAVNRPKQKDKEQHADFINCTAWRSTAEFISRYFSKGSKIVVEGQLRNNDYTDQNNVKHYSIDVLIEGVEFCESKNSGENQQQNSDSSAAQNYSAPQQVGGLNIGDIGEFEEILGGDETPF